MPAEKPRAVHDIGAPVDDELREDRKLLGGVLEVGVLDGDDVPRDRGEPASQCRPFSLVVWLQKEREAELSSASR